MIAIAITPDTTLRDYFHKQFMPRTAPKAASAKYYGVCFRAFQKFAGRNIRIGEVDQEMLNRFRESLAAKNMKRPLGYVWLIRRMMSEVAPERFPPQRMQQFKYLIRNAPRGTLEHAYWKNIRPQLKRRHTSGTIRHLETGLGRFVFYRGGHTKLSEVDVPMIDAYEQWLVAGGMDCSTAGNYARKIRGVVRRLDPSKCAKKPGGRQTPCFRGNGEPESLRQFFELSYRPLRLLDASKGTIGQHRIVLNQFNEYAGRELKVAELTDDLLAGYMRWLLDEEYAVSGINNRRGYIQAWWRFAKRRGLIATLPDVPKLRDHLPEPDAWTAIEVARIIAAAEKMTGAIGELRAADWMQAIIVLGYYTALRRGTLLRLQLRHVNWQTGILDVPPQLMKNRRGKKFNLTGQALDALRRIREPERERLFPLSWSNIRSFYLRFDALLKEAGLVTGRRMKLHKLRRTSVTAAAIKGGMVAAMAIAGHSEAYVTQRYVDPILLPGHDVGAMLEPLPIGGATC